MSADDFAFTECPSCGAGVYDNRESNKKRVAEGKNAMPIFSCKAQCGWKKWPPRPAGQARSGGFSRGPQQPKWESWDALEKAYIKAGAIAVNVVTRIAASKNVEPTMADYLAATSTVFIAASRDGVKPTTKAESAS